MVTALESLHQGISRSFQDILPKYDTRGITVICECMLSVIYLPMTPAMCSVRRESVSVNNIPGAMLWKQS